MKITLKVRNKIEMITQKIGYFIFKRKTIKVYDPNYFNDKTIAIIGGANSAFIDKNGAYIDSFDIVIRINRGIDNYEDNVDYLGQKTDVLFHGLHEDPINGCGPVKPQEWYSKGVKKVIFPLYGQQFNNLIATYTFRGKGLLALEQVTNDIYKQMEYELEGFRPTTGFAALYLMSKVNYKKLFITGFTFFRTSHQKGYNDRVNIDDVNKNIKELNFHNPDYEFKIFKSIYERAHSIEIDKGMIEIFK